MRCGYFFKRDGRRTALMDSEWKDFPPLLNSFKIPSPFESRVENSNLEGVGGWVDSHDFHQVHQGLILRLIVSSPSLSVNWKENSIECDTINIHVVHII